MSAAAGARRLGASRFDDPRFDDPHFDDLRFDDPRVALPCPGVGRVRRGFESFSLDLAQALDGHVDLAMYGSGGVADQPVTVLPSVFREDPLLQRLMPGLAHAYARYRLEQVTFVVPLLWQLLRHPVEVVHVSDQFLAKLLQAARSRLGARYRVIFSNGAPWPADQLHRFDFSQVLTPLQYQEALESGVPEERLAMVPYGLRCAEFDERSRGTRDAARARLGISGTAFVVMCVAPLDFSKRTDHLIRELGSLGADVDDLVLVMAGQSTSGTPRLRELAAEVLPGRHRILTAQYDQMPSLYAACDVFTLCSVLEGFGRVVLEAMVVGRPALVDDNPHYAWIVPDARNRVSMEASGALTERVLALYRDRAQLQDIGQQNQRDVYARFDWASLRPAYLEMYRKAMQVSPRGA
jgi:glycosyltransferase involved in cell wall biosynthesis